MHHKILHLTENCTKNLKAVRDILLRDVINTRMPEVLLPLKMPDRCHFDTGWYLVKLLQKKCIF